MIDNKKNLEVARARIDERIKNKETHLYLYHNKITNLELLAALTGLTGLNLAQNNISNLAPLAALTPALVLRANLNSKMNSHKLKLL